VGIKKVIKIFIIPILIILFIIGIWIYSILKTAADTYNSIWGSNETVLSLIFKKFKGVK
jgi:hypothetical protein